MMVGYVAVHAPMFYQKFSSNYAKYRFEITNATGENIVHVLVGGKNGGFCDVSAVIIFKGNKM